MTDDELFTLVQQAVKHAPTPYNTQFTAAVLVVGEKHAELWDVIKKGLEGGSTSTVGRLEHTLTVAAAGNSHGAQMAGSAFRGGYGTVLFFNDRDVLKQAEEAFKSSFEVSPRPRVPSASKIKG